MLRAVATKNIKNKTEGTETDLSNVFDREYRIKWVGFLKTKEGLVPMIELKDKKQIISVLMPNSFVEEYRKKQIKPKYFKVKYELR